MPVGSKEQGGRAGVGAGAALPPLPPQPCQPPQRLALGGARSLIGDPEQCTAGQQCVRTPQRPGAHRPWPGPAQSCHGARPRGPQSGERSGQPVGEVGMAHCERGDPEAAPAGRAGSCTTQPYATHRLSSLGAMREALAAKGGAQGRGRAGALLLHSGSGGGHAASHRGHGGAGSHGAMLQRGRGRRWAGPHP